MNLLQNHDGDTALHAAAQYGHTAVVSLLLQASYQCTASCRIVCLLFFVQTNGCGIRVESVRFLCGGSDAEKPLKACCSSRSRLITDVPLIQCLMSYCRYRVMISCCLRARKTNSAYLWMKTLRSILIVYARCRSTEW